MYILYLYYVRIIHVLHIRILWVANQLVLGMPPPYTILYPRPSTSFLFGDWQRVGCPCDFWVAKKPGPKRRKEVPDNFGGNKPSDIIYIYIFIFIYLCIYIYYI